jgi:hypothetical protein
MSNCSASLVLSDALGRGRPVCRDPGPDGAGVERPLKPKGSGKRSAPLGEIETLRNRMHMCAPSRSSAALVGYDAAYGSLDVPDNPEKVRLRRPLPAPDAGPDRLRTPHPLFSLPRPPGLVPGPPHALSTGPDLPGRALGQLDVLAGVGGAEAEAGAVSGRMSMRHPVIRAASRAFCPSLPMASESW